MKNKSWQYPFPTLEDKIFDSNKDGELDTFETMFRDAALNESNQKAKEYAKRQEEKRYYNNEEDEPQYNTSRKDTSVTNASGGSELLAILFSLIVLIGGIVLAITVEASLIVSALILFSAVGIALSILKAVGLYG